MRRFGQLFCSIIILVGISNLWAGNPDDFENFRRGVVVLSIYKNIVLDIPLEGAQRTDNSDIDNFMDQIGATKIERTYPHCLPPITPRGDLTTIYTMYFSEKLLPAEVAEDLQRVSAIEFAHEWFYFRTYLEHNDTRRNNDGQYYLDKTEANNAHDLATGNSSTIVAIVDTGTDMDHSDLEDNIWVNPGEDLNGNGRIDNDERNGEDDDNNGLIDDFYGWDYFRDDNNPNDESGHGTHCSGDAAATTNNENGIASIGYDCTIMPVRAGNNQTITHGYIGIEYAVRNGAHVISLSWGGRGRSDAADRVIQNAYNNDVMVIAAAGNDNEDSNFYPARYDNVIAVAATDNRDRKAGFSNYGDWIDISAPGVGIYSTRIGGGYGNMSGTSMACPIVAGAAVLIRSAYPWMNVDEVAEILLDGADDINLNNMGSGRLNIYESLLLGARPLLNVEEFTIIFDDNDDEHMDPGETVDIAITLTNGENGIMAENIVVSLTSADAGLFIENGIVEFPDIEPGEEFSNEENPFQIIIQEDAIAHTTWLQVNVNADPAGANITQIFEIVIGHPSILVVDDDESEDAAAANAIYRAIEKNGMGWAHWISREDYAPDLITLLDHDLVIWLTGNTENPLDDLDRWQIESALEEDANMLLIGNRIGDDEANSRLLSRFFGARHEEDAVDGMFASGISDDRPLEEETELMLFHAGFEDNYDGRTSASSMSVTRGGNSLLNYTIREEVYGLAAVYNVLDFGERSESRTVYMGFAFEAVRDDFTTPRDVALGALYNWFTGELPDPDVAPDLSGGFPTEYSLLPSFPNPFNGSVLINFNLPHNSSYQVSIFDMAGRNVSNISSGISTTGSNSLVWNAGAKMSSGNYFVRLSSPGQRTLQQKIILLK